MELLKHHIEETRERFDEVRGDLQDIRARLEDMQEFKISMVANSRLVSFVISAVSGLITLIVSVLTVTKIGGK